MNRFKNRAWPRILHHMVWTLPAMHSKFTLKAKVLNTSEYQFITKESFEYLSLKLHRIFFDRNLSITDLRDDFYQLFNWYKNSDLFDHYDKIKVKDDEFPLWDSESATSTKWENYIAFLHNMTDYMGKLDDLFISNENDDFSIYSFLKQPGLINSLKEGDVKSLMVSFGEISHMKLIKGVESIVEVSSSGGFILLTNGKYIPASKSEIDRIKLLLNMKYKDLFNSNVNTLVDKSSKLFDCLQAYVFNPLLLIRDAFPKLMDLISHKLADSLSAGYKMQMISNNYMNSKYQSLGLDSSAIKYYNSTDDFNEFILKGVNNATESVSNVKDQYIYYLDDIFCNLYSPFTKLEFQNLQTNKWYEFNITKFLDMIHGGEDQLPLLIVKKFVDDHSHIMLQFQALKSWNNTILDMSNSDAYIKKETYLYNKISLIYGVTSSPQVKFMLVRQANKLGSNGSDGVISLVIASNIPLNIQSASLTFQDTLTLLTGVNKYFIPEGIYISDVDENIASLASSFSLLSYIATGISGTLSGGPLGGFISLMGKFAVECALSIASRPTKRLNFDNFKSLVRLSENQIPIVRNNVLIFPYETDNALLPSVITGVNFINDSINYFKSITGVISSGLVDTITWSCVGGAIGASCNMLGRLKLFAKTNKLSQYNLFKMNGDAFYPNSHGELIQFIQSGKFSVGQPLPNSLKKNLISYKFFREYTKANGLVRPISVPQFKFIGRMIYGMFTFSGGIVNDAAHVLAAAIHDQLKREDNVIDESPIKGDLDKLNEKFDDLVSNLERIMGKSAGEV